MASRIINLQFMRIPLIALGLAFAAWSAMTGLAAFDYFRVQSYLESWSYQTIHTPNYKVPEAEYQDALAAAQKALALIPYNSDYHVVLADILAWQFISTPNLTPATRDSLSAEIQDHYRIAIKQRPSWPYTYSQFALTKLKLGLADQEMMSSLQKANLLGPREVDIMHVTINIGLANWQRLDHNTRLTVAQAIDRSLSWNLDEPLNAREVLYALSFVGLFQMQAEICPLLTTKSPQVTNLCGAIIAPDSAKAHK